MTISGVLFKPHGRIDRSTYWILSIVISLPFFLMSDYESELDTTFEYTLFIVTGFLALYSGAMLQIKRWHDRSKSGWWLLINLIPFGGIWALIECGFLAGDEDSNKYGPPMNEQLIADGTPSRDA